MANALKRSAKNFAHLFVSPTRDFHRDDYLRIDHRRLEHLTSLGLDLHHKRVLEVGAGIGDLTSYFLDRGCTVTSTEAREKNLKILRDRHPQVTVRRQNLEDLSDELGATFEVVFSFGLLYHLGRPADAITLMARHCDGMLLLETAVSFGSEREEHLVDEPANVASQSVSGGGCRPTRPWVFHELKKHFEHVYMPTTQPNHEQFPVDWDAPLPGARDNVLVRSVFVASRTPISNPQLVPDVPLKQTRH